MIKLGGSYNVLIQNVRGSQFSGRNFAIDARDSVKDKLVTAVLLNFANSSSDFPGNLNFMRDINFTTAEVYVSLVDTNGVRFVSDMPARCGCFVYGANLLTFKPRLIDWAKSSIKVASGSVVSSGGGIPFYIVLTAIIPYIK